jgi:hypothetical protein
MRSIIRPRTANYQTRESLVARTYYPDATNTGHLGLSTLTNTITTNQSYSTGVSIQNTFYDGARVSITGANATFRNCLFTGDNSVNALVTASNVNAFNAQFIDCTFLPKFPRYGTFAFNGHDGKFYRCDMSHCDDALHLSNSTAFTNLGAGFPIGVEVWQSYLHDHAWWTAATGGVVHPTDTETHNDLIQIDGGSGLVVVGSTLLARFAKQYGHWQVTNPNAEPYTTVTLGSLPDGGPFQPIPNRGSTGGSALSAGNEGNGRYNWDDTSALLMTDAQGVVSNVTFEDNLVGGGNFAINGGGNAYAGGGENLGSWKRNAFIDDQGNYGSGLASETGHTLDFGGTWAGRVTAPTTGADKNFYLATGNAITVRT